MVNRLFLMLLLGVLTSFSAFAQSPFLDLHSQAKVLYEESSVAVDDYVFALGKYRKSNNLWLPSSALRLQGQLARYTLEMPRDYSEQQVFDFYRQQLPSDVEVLFSCQKRQCGESNNWANDHFGVKQLYGINASQYYLGVRHRVDDSVYYTTIYSVRRGNRRVYVQLEQVQMPAG